MRLREIPVYPFLLASWPPLALAARNPGETPSPLTLIAPILVGCIVAAVSWHASRLTGRIAERRAVAVVVVIIGWWWYQPIVRLIQGSPIIHAIGLGGRVPEFMAIITLAAAWLLARRLPDTLIPRALWALVTTLILIGMSATSLLGTTRRPRAAEAEMGPPPERGTAVRNAATPDIYLIVLDSYTSRRSLLANYGFDNSAFERALRERGFLVPRDSRANYTMTSLALASMLNWDYLQSLLGPSWDTVATDQSLLTGMVRDNRTVRSLRATGYEFVFFANTVGVTMGHPWADVTISGRPRSGWFTSAWVRLTPLPELRRVACALLRCRPSTALPWLPDTAPILEEKFAALAELPLRPGPVFAFAHLLLPHEPYVYQASCAPRDPPYWPDLEGGSDPIAARQGYLEQLQCTNQKILALVDTLLSRSAVQPIIILQSDHGFGLSQLNAMEAVPPALVVERMDAFGAYLAPLDRLSTIGDTATPVTALRHLLSGFPGPPWGALPDHSFWSSRARPFAFTRIPAP